MTRDGIIKAVASLVGTKHKVDLKDYDVLILVEVLKVCIFSSILHEDSPRIGCSEVRSAS